VPSNVAANTTDVTDRLAKKPNATTYATSRPAKKRRMIIEEEEDEEEKEKENNRSLLQGKEQKCITIEGRPKRSFLLIIPSSVAATTNVADRLAKKKNPRMLPLLQMLFLDQQRNASKLKEKRKTISSRGVKRCLHYGHGFHPESRLTTYFVPPLVTRCSSSMSPFHECGVSFFCGALHWP